MFSQQYQEEQDHSLTPLEYRQHALVFASSKSVLWSLLAQLHELNTKYYVFQGLGLVLLPAVLPANIFYKPPPREGSLPAYSRLETY